MQMGEMNLLKENLVDVERAWRRNDTLAVYEAYRNLAVHFATTNKPKRSVSFFLKCLEMAASCDYYEGELRANLNLGLAYESMQDTQNAIQYHEAHMEMALSSENQVEASKAYSNLIRVYQRFADELEAQGEHELALEQLQLCLEAAQGLGNNLAEGVAQFRIGKCLQRMGRTKEVLERFTEYHSGCIALGDKVGEGKALCALADAYKDIGRMDEAVKNLEAFLELAKSGDPKSHANACCSLGQIYYDQGKFEPSVTYFEKFFDLSRSLGDKHMLDVARINLGIARGKAKFRELLEVLNNNMHSLLQWKNVRLPFEQNMKK